MSYMWNSLISPFQYYLFFPTCKCSDFPSRIIFFICVLKFTAVYSTLLFYLNLNDKCVILSVLLQVEALAVKLTQREGELIQEKFEVKKLANFLKQVSQRYSETVVRIFSYFVWKTSVLIYPLLLREHIN